MMITGRPTAVQRQVMLLQSTLAPSAVVAIGAGFAKSEVVRGVRGRLVGSPRGMRRVD
jgi:hypothetical protein